MTSKAKQQGSRNGKPPPRDSLTETMDRQPPFDPQAESGVLGSIFLLPDVLDDVAMILSLADFYDDAHGKHFGHMLAAHQAGRKIDPTLLVGRLRTAGDFEAIGGAAYLSKIINAVPNAAHAAYHARIVREKSRLCQLIVHCTLALQQAYDGLPADEVAACVESKLATLGHNEQRAAQLIADVAGETLASIEASADAPTKPGAMTGIPTLDEAIGPIMAGELMIIAARPGQGKTALGTQVALHAAERGRSALLVSLEMKDPELALRVLCGWAELDSRDVRSGHVTDDGRQKLRAALEQLRHISLLHNLLLDFTKVPFRKTHLGNQNAEYSSRQKLHPTSVGDLVQKPRLSGAGCRERRLTSVGSLRWQVQNSTASGAVPTVSSTISTTNPG